MILSVALVVGCIYISEPMEAEAAAPTKFNEVATDTGARIVQGSKVFSEKFSNITVGALPTGWQSYEGSWVWNSGETQTDIVEVQKTGEEKYLKISDTDRTVALVFHSTGVSNYVLTARVRLDELKGTIGLITNITDPVTSSGTNSKNNAVTMSLLKLDKDATTQKHMVELKNRAVNADVPNTSEKITIDKEFEKGKEVTLTACRYAHYTYFYIEDVYIGKKQNIGYGEENNLCGFYLMAGTVSLKEVTVSKLERDTSADIRPHVEVLENIITEDFTKKEAGTGLPKDWRLIKGTEGKQWLWNNTANASASQAVQQTTEGLLLQANVSDGALLLPALPTADYVMTATVICKSNSGHVGLLSNVDENSGTTRSVVNMMSDAEPVITQRNRVQATTPALQTIPRTEVIATPPGLDTELTLTVYSFRGHTYFYIKDVFVQELAQRNPQTNSGVCGLVVCSASMLIKNITIDAIRQAGDISKEVYATDTLLLENFSQVETGSLPTDWQVLQNQWLWNPTNEGGDTIKVSEKDNQKYLDITDWDGTVGVILPAIGTADYVMSATVIPSSNNGTVGLMTNIKEPLSKGVGATHSILSLKGNAGTTDLLEQNYKHENMSVYDKKTFYMSLLGEEPLGSADTITLKVYSYQGYSYFYINDTLVLYTANRNAELETSLCGLYVCGTSVKVTNVSVEKIEPKGQTSAAQMVGAAVRYADADGVERGAASSGMRFVASVDKDSFLYRTSDNVELGMIVRPADDLNIGDNITLETEGVVDFPLDEIVSEDDKTLQYATTLMGLIDLDEYYAARAYMKVDGQYYYSNQIKRSQARLATRLASDDNMIDESIETKLTSIFNGTKGYVKADDVKTLDFTVLGDLHYKEGMYAATIEDLTTILNRADENKSRFVMHMGDFCNDYMGSVELTNAYMDSMIPTYGIYGNHELESANNSMAYVTPLLTNQAENVVWGTADGKIGDGSIGYYYFDDDKGDDASGFRIVCTDSNYSWNEASREWQHNTTNSYGSPTGNTEPNSLGDVQLAWLKDVLLDAAQRAIPCVVLSHATMSGSWEPSPDSEEVQTIFREVNEERKGTVLLALNGHNHQDHMKVIDDVVYIDINTVRNGFWNGSAGVHYTDEHTFNYVKYKADGSVASTQEASLNVLSSGGSTWFFEEPVSANIRISTAGYIHVDGFETTWMYGVEPDVSEAQARVPWISDYKIDFLY